MKHRSLLTFICLGAFFGQSAVAASWVWSKVVDPDYVFFVDADSVERTSDGVVLSSMAVRNDAKDARLVRFRFYCDSRKLAWLSWARFEALNKLSYAGESAGVIQDVTLGHVDHQQLTEACEGVKGARVRGNDPFAATLRYVAWVTAGQTGQRPR